MACVVSERDGFAIRRPQSPLCAEDEELSAPGFGWIPAHPGVLRHPKKIAAGTVQQHFFRQGQTACGPACARLNPVNFRCGRIEHIEGWIHFSSGVTGSMKSQQRAPRK
jgi:hypothetical protein